MTNQPPTHSPSPPSAWRRWLPRSGWEGAAWALSAVYIAVMSYLAIQRHAAFNSTVWDLGLYEQVVWNIAHGNGWQSSIRGFNFLGEHLAFGLALIAPIYALFPAPHTLLIIQSAGIGLGGIAAYRLACRHLDGGPLALALSGGYLAMPILGFANMVDFHPEPIIATLLLFALNALEEEQMPLLVGLLTLALLTREEAALAIAPFGLYAWWRGYRRLGAALLIAPLVYLVLAITVITPFFRDFRAAATPAYLLHYGHLGESSGAIVRTALLRPLHTVSVSHTARKALTAWRLVWPLALLPLLGPARWPLALPVLLINYLSQRDTQFNETYQYLSLAAPGLYAAAVQGVDNITGWLARLPGWLVRGALIGGIVVGAGLSARLQADHHRRQNTFVAPGNKLQLQAAVNAIPEGVSVGATNTTGAHLAGREELYFAAPFLYETGYSAMMGVPQVVDADYMLLDMHSGFERDIEAHIVRLTQSPDYELIYWRNGVALYRRRTG